VSYVVLRNMSDMISFYSRIVSTPEYYSTLKRTQAHIKYSKYWQNKEESVRIVQKGIAKYRNYGNYSNLPTFISQGIYDNEHFLLKYLGKLGKGHFVGLEIPVSYRDFSTDVTPHS